MGLPTIATISIKAHQSYIFCTRFDFKHCSAFKKSHDKTQVLWENYGLWSQRDISLNCHSSSYNMYDFGQTIFLFTYPIPLFIVYLHENYTPVEVSNQKLPKHFTLLHTILFFIFQDPVELLFLCEIQPQVELNTFMSLT